MTPKLKRDRRFPITFIDAASPLFARIVTSFHSIHIVRSCNHILMWCVCSGVFSASFLYSLCTLRPHIRISVSVAAKDDNSNLVTFLNFRIFASVLFVSFICKAMHVACSSILKFTN